MAEKEYFIDDRVIIPEEIKKMSAEERKRNIERLEAEARAKKKEIVEKRTRL
ncbi:MAG: hypothetical protein NC084_06925 [Bacteroides sp.]|nr:hypothetical protein [Eubacterium sp.]MCM1418776.1 hypothetical protein [Roseburia sp.]MCM1462433.1 hypothetical protein [Bacteroides sp.]